MRCELARAHERVKTIWGKRQIFTRRSSFESHYCTRLKLEITTTTADISSHLADPARDPAVANNSNKDVRRKLMSWFIGGIVELLNGRCFCVEYLVYAKACARLQLSKLSLIFLHNFTIVIVTALTVCCRHRTNTGCQTRRVTLHETHMCATLKRAYPWLSERHLDDCVCEYEFANVARTDDRTDRSPVDRQNERLDLTKFIFVVKTRDWPTERRRKSLKFPHLTKKICRCLIKNGDKTLLRRKHSSGSEFWKIPFCLPSTP